ESRLNQVAEKLSAVPKLLASARENIRTPPQPFVERAIVMFRGASDLIAHDLPLAFESISSPALQNGLQSASAGARRAIDEYAAELESKVLPQATGAYALGTAAVEARYRAEELIDTPAAGLLAIGERELRALRGEFDATAARIDSKRPPLAV